MNKTTSLFPKTQASTASILTGQIVLLITLTAVLLFSWGLRKDLPYSPEIDEPDFVLPTVQIAATGELNPHWFGHPGSTVIYPLAAIYRVQHAARMVLGQGTPGIDQLFEADPGSFYLLGRWLSICYAAAAMFLVYQIGRQAFQHRVGVLGAWLSMLVPLTASQVQLIRTDGASLFFTVLCLWLMLRLYRRPSLANQVLAGAAAGLAISTKYSLGSLLVLLACVEGLLLLQTIKNRREDQSSQVQCSIFHILIALSAAGLAFALTTPYFFLDFGTAFADFRSELRTNHLGADGFSFLQNLRWYLVSVIPANLSWPAAILVAPGVFKALHKRKPEPVLLLVFLLMHLLIISRSPLHWGRWLIPVFPILCLFAASSLWSLSRWAERKINLPDRRLVSAGLVVLVSIWPAYQVLLHDYQESRPSTQVLAREWVLENLPAGSRIAKERYAAALTPDDFFGFMHQGKEREVAPPTRDDLLVLDVRSLAEHATLEEYLQDGYRYFVVSSTMYDRYLAEPDRYARQVHFYTQLFQEGTLLQEFTPSTSRRGSTVRVYTLANGSG